MIGVFLALFAASACVGVAAAAWWRSVHNEVLVCEVCGVVRTTGQSGARRYDWPNSYDPKVECRVVSHRWKKRWQ